VINRRENYLDHDLRCLLKGEERRRRRRRRRKQLLAVDGPFHIRTIRTKFFPGHITVYDGKTLAATFSVSKVEETDSIPTTIFEQPAQSEWRPWCASPEAGGDPLTPIYSRLGEHKSTSTLYGAIGTDGQWYRVHVLESGGPSHDAEVLEALKKERWKPSSCNSVPIVVETVFRR
jgi:hypothetical protein